LGIPLSLEYGAEWDESYALLSISTILQLVGPRVFFFVCFNPFFLNACVQKKQSGNSQKRKSFFTPSHPSLKTVQAKLERLLNSLRIRKGIIPLRGVRGWPRWGLGGNAPKTHTQANTLLPHFALEGR